jgi:hypothetical protein
MNRSRVIIKPFCNNYDYLPNHGDIFKIHRIVRKQRLIAAKLAKKVFHANIMSPKTDVTLKQSQRKAFKITKTPEKKIPDEV